MTFRPSHDDSYITHWLSWRDIDVEWREIAPGQTEVSWTLRYRRRLDPAWYFAPLERYAAGLAAGYLIDTLATPSAPNDTRRPICATSDRSRHALRDQGRGGRIAMPPTQVQCDEPRLAIRAFGLYAPIALAAAAG